MRGSSGGLGINEVKSRISIGYFMQPEYMVSNPAISLIKQLYLRLQKTHNITVQRRYVLSLIPGRALWKKRAPSGSCDRSLRKCAGF